MLLCADAKEALRIDPQSQPAKDMIETITDTVAAAMPDRRPSAGVECATRFQPGDRVRVGGLRSAVELNGLEGVVKGAVDASMQRYTVTLGGREVNVKPENLARVFS